VSWQRFLGRRRIAAAAIAVIVLVVGIAWLASSQAARGDDPTSSNDGASAADDAQAAAFKFSECMREHGIDDYPDPTVEPDGGIHFEGIPGDPSSEQFQAAKEACQPILDEAPPQGAGGSKQVEPGPEDSTPAGWERVVPGGQCRCADGSDYSFYVHQANPTKVVFFLDGGGACWSAATCAPASGNEYQMSVEAPNGEGVFDFTDERNPFADYSFVFVPYCTADLHVGTATTEYAPDLTIHHKGYVNATTALDYLVEKFPGATHVVVIGVSAGSVTSALYAGLASDRVPKANITVFADSSGSYPDVPALNEILAGSAWGASKVLPDWSKNARQTDAQWSAPGLVIQTWRHDANIVFARYDHAYDQDQASHLAPACPLTTCSTSSTLTRGRSRTPEWTSSATPLPPTTTSSSTTRASTARASTAWRCSTGSPECSLATQSMTCTARNAAPPDLAGCQATGERAAMRPARAVSPPLVVGDVALPTGSGPAGSASSTSVALGRRPSSAARPRSRDPRAVSGSAGSSEIRSLAWDPRRSPHGARAVSLRFRARLL
jgi:Pectinacetylesterase